MTENEPLNDVQSQVNARILPAANGHTNGQVHANGKDSMKPPSPVQNGNGTHIEAPCCRDIHGKEPPDGGARAWLVMVSAFLCNGIIFGFINTYGVIHSLLTERLTKLGDPEASSKAGKSDTRLSYIPSRIRQQFVHNPISPRQINSEFVCQLLALIVIMQAGQMRLDGNWTVVFQATICFSTDLPNLHKTNHISGL